MPDIGMVVREGGGLSGDRVRDLGSAIPDIDAVKPGKGVQATLALIVADVDAMCVEG